MAAILASDSDSGSNGEITYSVEEDDEDATFLLNPVTGVFNVTRPLDYESQQYYILTVQARDGGGLSSSVRVYFNLLDVNDNPPVFNSSMYSSSVLESLSPGTSVLTVSARDADDGMSSSALDRWRRQQKRPPSVSYVGVRMLTSVCIHLIRHKICCCSSEDITKAFMVFCQPSAFELKYLLKNKT